MKRNILLFEFVMSVLLVILVSCQPNPQNFLRDFERFITKVEKNGPRYSKEEWDNCDQHFSEFKGNKLEEVRGKMTREDKKLLGHLVARYYKAKAIAFGDQMIDEAAGTIEFFKGLGEGWLD